MPTNNKCFTNNKCYMVFEELNSTYAMSPGGVL